MIDNKYEILKILDGIKMKIYKGYEKDVISLTISKNERLIISGSRDKTIRLWNTLGECKFIFAGDSAHKSWVCFVRFSPINNYTFFSFGLDKALKSWDLKNYSLQLDLCGQYSYFSCAELAPDGTVLALGGRDGKVLLWADDGELLETLEFGESIVALCFKTTGYVITVATPTSIKNWDLSNKCIKSSKSTEICTPETLGKKKGSCSCIRWSEDDKRLYAGYTDGKIVLIKLCND